MPEDLRAELLAGGYSRIEVGNLCLNLLTGSYTRLLFLNDKEVAKLTFPGPEIDWNIVRGFVHKTKKGPTKEQARQRLLDDMEIARGLECSFCGAAPFEECTWPLGKDKAIHAARMPAPKKWKKPDAE